MRVEVSAAGLNTGMYLHPDFPIEIYSLDPMVFARFRSQNIQ